MRHPHRRLHRRQPFRTRADVAITCALLAITLLTSAPAPAENLEREFIEPVQDVFTQVVTVAKNGTKTIYVSGQTGVGETLAEQSRSLYASMKERLEKAGATPADVVKLVTYVVDWSPEKGAGAFAGFTEVFGEVENKPAHTLIGVQALFQPQVVIEVEAVAVIETSD